MLGLDFVQNPVSDEQYHSPFSLNSISNANLFVTGGLFLEPTVSSSFLRLIPTKASSISISCSVSSPSKRVESSSSLFLSVSLRNEGKLCLGQIEEKAPPNETKIEAETVVIEANVVKKKTQVTGAMNTTKHLWAGAIAAMISR